MDDGAQLTIAGRFWQTFRRLLPGEQRREQVAAYNRVFRTGGASSEDRQRVLVDLANVSGFYRVTPPRAGESVEYHCGLVDGQRQLFAHIYGHLRQTEIERASLEEAARTDFQLLTGSNGG